jgi:multimeric flavodoxin WrbA
MKILAINGSPRKTWNTVTLLQNALDGAASGGAETELVHLSMTWTITAVPAVLRAN